jgi:hypothetical protein
MFTFSKFNRLTIGQILKAVSAFSVAADINIIMRFQPPSLDRIFIFLAFGRIPPISSKLYLAL